METVRSTDGTQIAYERPGSGPPLVLLHGSSASRDSWDPVVPHLADDFTLLVPDRRGRGDSGDADEYSLVREVADLRALVDAADGTPTVVGQSFGGLVALAAAPDLALDRLVLYEPAILVGEHRDGNLTERMAARVETGDRLGAMALFIEKAAQVDDVEQLSWWPEEANVHRVGTVIREGREVEAFDLAASPTVDVPTLLITGEHGPEHLRDAVFALDDHLPDSRVVELDGVGHMANVNAPGRLAAVVREFVRAS